MPTFGASASCLILLPFISFLFLYLHGSFFFPFFFSLFPQITGRWVPAALTDQNERISRSSTETAATSVALNPRFRLLAVGCTNGDVHVFNVDSNMTPTFSHTLSFHSRSAPMRGEEWDSGPVTDIKWSDDGYALALAQEEGGLSIWSVFGSSLMSTSADVAMAAAGPDTPSLGIRSVSWGPCGYHLIALPAFVCGSDAAQASTGSIFQFHFTHSALTTNACLSNQFNVMLLGEDRLCLNPDTNSSTRLGGDVDKLCDVQWQSIQIPIGYLKGNWPIQRAALDPSGKFAVVAGTNGFCHYSTVSRKWRVFGNVAQEKAFSCSGGLAWWAGYIITACLMVDGTEEIRFYPKSSNLDNRHIACRKVVSKSVVLINVFSDYLIITTVNKKTLIYKMSETKRGNNPVQVDLELAWDVGMTSYILNPTSLVSVTLLQLGHDSAPSTSSSEPGALIVNVAGNLMVLSLSDNAVTGGSEFSDPALIATGVESYWGWTPTTSVQVADQVLSQALWLGCGGRGMQVWLPLHQSHVQPMPEGSQLDYPAVVGSSSSGLDGGVDGDGHVSNHGDSAREDAASTFTPTNGGSGSDGSAADQRPTPTSIPENSENVVSVASGGAADATGNVADSDAASAAASSAAPISPTNPSDAAVAAERTPTPSSHIIPPSPVPGALYKRIMLPFDLNVYPLSVLFEDAVVLGASHEAYRTSGSTAQAFPFCTLERKTQIYLHHVLRQLLRRNQDHHALAIAKASSKLPYFNHVLELMLHEVLEDEAHRSTPATPIEDAQLPKVVDFLRHFGTRLDTIVHCARKTEVTKWKYFFSVVGDPKDLFDECVKLSKFDTAASCLVFLQTLESPTVSRRYALPLVHHALDAEQWELAKDLNRFLKATASYESSPEKAASAAGEAIPLKTSQVFVNYALGLLDKSRIRALALFSANMGFPMVSWLYTIRVKHGSIKDVGTALEVTTKEFNLTVAAANSSAADKRQDELEFLLASIFEAQCFEWALLFCVVLRDTAASYRVLDEVAADKTSPSGTFGLLNRFRKATARPAGAVHKQFVDSLTTTFKPATPMQKDIERERDPRRSTAAASDAADAGGECGVM